MRSFVFNGVDFGALARVKVVSESAPSVVPKTVWNVRTGSPVNGSLCERVTSQVSLSPRRLNPLFVYFISVPFDVFHSNPPPTLKPTSEPTNCRQREVESTEKAEDAENPETEKPSSEGCVCTS